MIKKEAHIEKPKAGATFPIPAFAGIIIVVLLYFIAGETGKIVFGLAASILHITNPTYTQFFYTLAVESLTIVLLFMVMRMSKVSLPSIGLVRPKLSNIAASLVGYGVYFLLLAVAVAVAHLFHVISEQQQQLGFDSVHGTLELIAAFVSLVLLPPIVEEIVMRGFLFSSLKRDMSVVKAAVLTSLLFAFAHLQLGTGAPPLWLAAIDTFVLSLVLCTLRQKTGNLWAGVGVHMLKNGIAYVAIFIVPLTGGIY